MKELKSKKSGAPPHVVSEEEYAEIVNADKSRKFKILDRFKVTDLKMHSIIPSLKEPKEIKITKKTKE